MRTLPLALAFLVVAAPGAARDLNAVPPAVATGKPQSCVPISQLRSSYVRNDRVIDFEVGARKYYRVTLPQGCPELGFEKRFAYETSLSQLCSTDIITVLHETGNIRGASCGLAPFQPVTIARR